MEDFNKVPIPEDVVDVTQYKIYCALQNHPVLKNIEYIASDGTSINIGALPNIVRQRIEHLSPVEQEKILEMKHQYSIMRGKVAVACAKAFGRSGRYGGKNREELAKYKLTPFEADIIELLGRMFTTQEVVKIMVQDNQIECTEQDVKDILRKHIAEIEKKREEFRSKVTDVRLYNKRPRLEELAWMYGKMKFRYIQLNNTDCYNAMLRTLEQIRKEAEGDVININGALDVSIETSIQLQIQREALRTINLKEIILGRVAARMNYDPKKLIAGLHNSQYAKFIDIGGDFDPNAEMNYPSASPYDFAKIEREAEQEIEDVTPEEMTVEEHKTAQDIKQMFLDKIHKQKAEMEQRSMKFDAQTPDKDMEKEKPIKRGKGSAKDKNIPSREKRYENTERFAKKDYKTGEKKQS